MIGHGIDDSVRDVNNVGDVDDTGEVHDVTDLSDPLEGIVVVKAVVSVLV